MFLKRIFWCWLEIMFLIPPGKYGTFPKLINTEMPTVLSYKQYVLLERFDLQSEVKKQKLQPEFIDEAKELVAKYTPNGKLPDDIELDKVVLWVAKQIKNFFVLRPLRQALDNAYKEKDLEDGMDKYQEIKLQYDYAKGDIPSPKGHRLHLNSAISSFKGWTRWQSVFDYLFSRVRNTRVYQPDLIGSTPPDMLLASENWHKELKASGLVTQEDGTVIMEFPDGYYWIDLETNSCEVEGQAMGHCANTSADTMLSLRQKKEQGAEPHVTVAIDGSQEEGYTNIHQIKGKGNKKPVEKYHKYIVDLLIKYKIATISNDEYRPSEDFNIGDLTDLSLIEKVLHAMPELYVNGNCVLSKNAYNVVVPYLEKHGLLEQFVTNRGFVSDIYELWSAGKISNKTVLNLLPDLVIDEKQWFIKEKGDALKDLDFLYSDNDSSNDHYSSQELVGKYSMDAYEMFDYYPSYDEAKDMLDDVPDDIVRDLIARAEKSGYTMADFEDKDWYDDKSTLLDVAIKDRDALKDICEEDDDLGDEIRGAYSEAYTGASEAAMWKDMLSPLDYFFGNDTSKTLWTSHKDGHFFLPFHVGMAKQVEPYYGLSTSKVAESHFSKSTPMSDLLHNLFDFEDMEKDEDEAEFKPMEIRFPYNGWDESPSTEAQIEALQNRL